jgi:hypothetical protein
MHGHTWPIEMHLSTFQERYYMYTVYVLDRVLPLYMCTICFRTTGMHFCITESVQLHAVCGASCIWSAGFVGSLPQDHRSITLCLSSSSYFLYLDRMTAIRAGTWAVPFEGGSWHGLLTRPEARYDTKYFGPCRYDTNTRAVPCLESRHDGLHGPARILGRAWAGTARK